MQVPPITPVIPAPQQLPAGPNFSANIPNQTQVCPPTASYGSIDAHPPIPDKNDSAKLIASVGYNVARLAHPETQTKPGAPGGIKINEESWVFAARYFNDFLVALRPGVTGEQLASGLKSMYDRRRPLYDNVGFRMASDAYFEFWAHLSYGGVVLAIRITCCLKRTLSGGPRAISAHMSYRAIGPSMPKLVLLRKLKLGV